MVKSATIGSIIFLSIFTVVILWRSPLRASRTPVCWHCNVILITVDSLRADSLPCYGYAKNTAPFMCEYAKKNILFSRAYAPSSWTLPSEMSLFTGLYPTNHGMDTAMQDMLNPQITTLPMALQKSGYETTAISNAQPNIGLEQGLGRGFTTVKATPNTPHDAIPMLLEAVDTIQTTNDRHKPAFVYFHTDGVHNYNSGFPDVPSSYPLDPTYHPPMMPKDMYAFTQNTWDVMLDHLLWVTNVDGNKNIDDPYTRSYTHLMNAKTLSEAKTVFDSLPSADRNAISWESGNDKVREFLGSDYAPLSRHLYDEAVRNVDTYMTQVFTRLAERNLDKNTIVIITSEHGEFLGERGLFGHGTQFFDPETHVPLIMHVPNVSQKTVTGLTSLLDVYATVIDLLELRVRAPATSVSQAKTLFLKRPASARTFVISEWFSNMHNKSIRTNEWHLLETRSPSGEAIRELYHILFDPSETTNVASTNASVVAALSKLLRDTPYSEQLYEPVSRSFPDWIDEAHRKKLIETGYY